jgi:hypothetical protein
VYVLVGRDGVGEDKDEEGGGKDEYAYAVSVEELVEDGGKNEC